MISVPVGIVTYERQRVLQRCISHLRRLTPDVEFYVADQSEVTSSGLVGLSGGHQVEVPTDCGLSAARNALVKAIDSEFIFLIDDDIVIDGRLDFPDLLDFLKSRDDLVAVGPQIKQRPTARRPWIGRLGMDGDRLMRYQRKVERVGVGRYLSDVIGPGVLLARRELLLEFPFDERLKLAEGLEWLWRVKNCGGRLGYSERGFVVHRQERDRSRESQRRFDRYQEKAWRLLGIKGVGCV